MKKILLTTAFALTFSISAHSATYYAAYNEDTEAVEINDPLESVNRATYAFNDVVDGYLLDPIFRTYNDVVPKWGRDRVSNFAYNVSEPVTVLNSVLQGDDINAFTSLWRFIINTTFGLLGTFDAASEVGLEKRQEGFGQTMYTWGLTDSPYLVLPILGPSTVANTFGAVADNYSNPFNYDEVLETEEILAHRIATGVSTKASAVVVTDKIKRDSLDPYVSLRSIYLQNFESRALNQ